MTSIMPLQTPQSRKSELTRMNVKTRFLPSLAMKRLFLGVFIGPASSEGQQPALHGRIVRLWGVVCNDFSRNQNSREQQRRENSCTHLGIIPTLILCWRIGWCLRYESGR